MKKAIIFINGNLSNFSYINNYIYPEDIIICADGGANYAMQHKIIPDVIIGDLDSISPDVQQYLQSRKTLFIPYPKEKDFTDTELALQYALKQSIDQIIIVGIMGDRFDHLFANIMHIAHIAKNSQPAKEILIMNGNQEIFIINKQKNIVGKKNDLLSLIPLRDNCKKITTKGLKYQLDTEDLPLGSTRGISNVFMQEDVSIYISDGSLLAIHTKES